MKGAPSGRLFWRVYPTLLASLVLVAVLGAVVWHLFGVAPMGTGPPAMPMHMGRDFHLRGLIMLLTVAAVVGIAAYPVVRRITRRLERLRLSVEAWGAGNPSHRAAVDGGDEIAAVAASFNAAADRADDLLAAHKALLAHASHELRSPLARLALAVELLAGEEDAERASAVRREIAELDELVGEILLASRLDHAGDPFETERVDLLALAAEEAARAGVRLREAPAGAGPSEVLGSMRLLRRLIRNLIDNAVEHGAPPVEVEVARASLGDEAAVSVRVFDHGSGISPALRERVFEPFFRPDGWSEEAGGWGLGLSLVRQIARRHGGRALCREENGTTAFVVDLPTRLK